MSHDRLALAAAAAAGVQVGAAIVVTRWVVDQTTPVSLAMMRYAIGFLCLLPAVVLAGRVRIERRDWLPVAMLGIGQFGILIVLLNVGLRYVPSARAALIFATFPLMTMGIAAALGHERITLARLLGVMVALLGITVALSERLVPEVASGAGPERALAASGDMQWIGDAAVAASALTGAICSVLYRPYLKKYPALPVSATAMLASVAFLAMLSVAEGSIGTPLTLSARGWAAVAFIGVSSGIGYFLWLWALRHATPTRVTIFLSLSPVTAAFLGALFLGEPVTLRVLAGAAGVIAGLWLATHAGGTQSR
jgi:drug/metabolite transporter (DMT)-like permease